MLQQPRDDIVGSDSARLRRIVQAHAVAQNIRRHGIDILRQDMVAPQQSGAAKGRGSTRSDRMGEVLNHAFQRFRQAAGYANRADDVVWRTSSDKWTSSTVWRAIASADFAMADGDLPAA